jgi:hypothetical protein
MSNGVKDNQMIGPTTESSKGQRRTEFDIHGVLGIRLVDPTSADVAAVKKQLGPLQKPLLREPDVTLRFAQHLPVPRLQHLGLRQIGFTEDAFIVFDEGANGAMAKIPFDLAGGAFEIVCERGLGSVPLLMPILSLTALAKGFVAVHASAFVHHGTGILMAGWAGSGKTTALLGFAFEGAEFIGEEWVLLSGDGQMMCGLPREIEVSPSHLGTVPDVRRAIKHSRLWAFQGLHHLGRMQGILGKEINSTFPAKVLRRTISAVQRRILPKVSPQGIFGSRVGSLIAKPEKVFLLISHDDTCVEVRPTPPSEMARRIAHMTQYEHRKFMEHYLAFKFAFPEVKNAFVEKSSAYQYELLSRALTAKETYTVWHPHRVDFSVLYEKIKPFCESTINAQNEAVCVPTSI